MGRGRSLQARVQAAFSVHDPVPDHKGAHRQRAEQCARRSLLKSAVLQLDYLTAMIRWAAAAATKLLLLKLLPVAAVPAAAGWSAHLTRERKSESSTIRLRLSSSIHRLQSLFGAPAMRATGTSCH